MPSLALYGGSFDPVHIGHLLLARDAMEQLGIEKVVLIPAKISPHKLDRPPSPPELRVEMLRAAVAGDPRFSVDDRELRREGPSFTIDTVRAYRAEFPETRLFFFLGDDNVSELHTWKDVEELKKLVQFVVLARSCSPLPVEFPRVGRLIEINSTEIRARVARGLSIEGMVPPAVSEIIARHGLYRHG